VSIGSAFGATGNPRDPDNAALLYYQALLIHRQPDATISEVYEQFVKGEAGPTEEIREYVRGSRAAIDYALMGARVEACDWGLPYSKGFALLLSHMSQLRSLTRLLLADARLLGAEGDYGAGLDRCLAVQRLAQHVGDDTLISYLVALGMRRLEYDCLKDGLGAAWNDAGLLQRLKDALAERPAREISAIRPLKIEMEIVTGLMRMDRRKELVRTVADDFGKRQLAANIATADERVLSQARRIYSDRVQTVLEVLDASLPYEQAYPQIKRLGEGLDVNDPAFAVAGAFLPSMGGVYSSETRTEAYANAIKAAIEIYMQRIKSGQLPPRLPPGLPKDPFSGEDFEYRPTDEGFVLRCRGKDLDEDRVHEYAFVVK
jgi:hypothetical protein